MQGRKPLQTFSERFLFVLSKRNPSDSASSQAAHPSPPGKPEVSVVSLLLLPHAKANLCMGTHVQRKRPRPRKEIRLLPYPTTTQPHSRVPYPTGQNGHAFPRNPARQTLATWAYVAATMLCCSTFHARDVKDAVPYKAFARHSRRNDYHPSAVREASPRMSWHKYPLTKLPLPVCRNVYYSVVRLV